MRSSRISICLINTRCSRNEQILAPFVLSLKGGYKIVVLQILEELLTDAQLNVLCGLQALLLEDLDIRWNVDAAHVVTYHMDSRLVDPPFGDGAIALEALLKLGRRCAV